MVARRQWSDLSDRTRRLLTITAVAEGILKLAALIDLKRRQPAKSRPEVAVGHGADHRQLCWGRANLLLRLRAAPAPFLAD
jgi:hypothetical protein